jgi:hypothetical protein
MSDLTSKDKLFLERFLGMGSGYVLDFSNRTFEEFILENTGIAIYDEKYNYSSGSKANRLRSFWEKESNYIVGKTIRALIEHRKTTVILGYQKIDEKENSIIVECEKIAERLLSNTPVEAIDALHVDGKSSEVSLLAESIIESIEKNQPQVGLDRLHTYMTNYLRSLCSKYGIKTDKTIPLNSLLGSYVKELEKRSLVESEMSIKILKSSISIFESFNEVRNDKSLAHDNKILNYNESILIINNVLNVLKFINAIEDKHTVDIENHENTDFDDDIPF